MSTSRSTLPAMAVVPVGDDASAKADRCWESMNRWLKTQRQSSDMTALVDQVERSIEDLQPQSQFRVYNHLFDSTAISRLLSPGRVGDDFINMSVISLMDRVRAGLYENVKSGVVITTSLLFNLMAHHKSWIHPVVANIMSREETKYLLMPAFLTSSEHYFALAVDKEHKRILIGDSLGTYWQEAKARITKWAQAILGFTPTYSDMPHAVQQDYVACGVATVNAMEHFLVDTTPLMTHEKLNTLRLELALRLTSLITREEPVSHLESNNLYGIKKSKSFWLCSQSTTYRLIAETARPSFSPSPWDIMTSNASPLNVAENFKSSIEVKKLQETMKAELLSVMEWATRLQVHSEIAIRHLRLYRRLPTVDEAFSISGFGAERVRVTHGRDMIPPHPLPLTHRLSVMAQAWRAVPVDPVTIDKEEEVVEQKDPEKEIHRQDNPTHTGFKRKDITE